ncbi:MAG: hypothetical protein V2A62_04855 [Candidatus Woesearchaeota archaeon]
MKINILMVLGLLLVVSLITACSSTVSDQQTANTPVDTSPKEDIPSGITGAAVGVLTEEVEEKSLPTNIWVQELKLKSSNIKNYHYYYISNYRNPNGLYIEDNSYKVYVYNTKVKKEYSQTQFLNKRFSYNEVYLDNVKHTAYGTCTLKGISCDEMEGKYLILNYFEELVKITPLDLVEKLDRTAKSLSSEELFDNREATLIVSKLPDGTLEKLWVDNFYGLPIKRIVYILNNNDEEVILETHTFTSISAGAGAVSPVEVSLPEGLTLQP